ncbi:MAG: type I-C CRISPR-associated protein Cas7/Csd2 [Bryobacteraceae bacterium]
MTVNKRYDFVYLFDCQDGNPNGDPDFDNTPRFDPETFHGLVSDVCLKRKIRDYVALAKTGEPGYAIFVTSGQTLESQQKLPYDKFAIKPKTSDRTEIARARQWMCENFFDVRAFGAVMSTTDFNCGQVRGPAQLTFARSIDRVFSTEHGITRVAYTKEEKAKATTASTEMGRKHTVAYGLYKAHGFINAALAAQTGFTEDDLELVWRALENMFDLDRSAARGLMSARCLFVFEHSSSLGEAPAQRLFDRVQVKLRDGVESPRGFDDYVVTANREGLPNGVQLLAPLAAHV